LEPLSSQNKDMPAHFFLMESQGQLKPQRWAVAVKKNLLITEFTNSRHNPETIIFFSNVKQQLDTCEALLMQK